MYNIYIYIYGIGAISGPHGAASARYFFMMLALPLSMLLQALMKKLEVLVMINQ